MINVRKSEDRGRTDLDWLKSRHSFSFGSYDDPHNMGFGPLRVINEDRVEPAAGFPTHGHRDMEIVTYILEGALEHKDSLGSGEVLRPGEVQRMTAGTGIRHSEFNPSKDEAVRLLQIWIEPERNGLTPGYEQKAIPVGERKNEFRLIASRDSRNGSVGIHRDADVHAALIEAGRSLVHLIKPGRKVWIQVADGGLMVNGTSLTVGDGAAIEGETRIEIAATEDSEFLLFDMA